MSLFCWEYIKKGINLIRVFWLGILILTSYILNSIMLNRRLWNYFILKIIEAFIIFDLWCFFRFFKFLKVIFLFFECIPILVIISLLRRRLLKLIESIIRSLLLPPSGSPLLSFFSWFCFLKLFKAFLFLIFQGLLLMQIFLFHLCCLWTRLIIEVSEAIILLGLLWSFGIFLSAPAPLRLLWVFIMLTLIFRRVFLILILYSFSRVLDIKIFEAFILALNFLFFFYSLEE